MRRNKLLFLSLVLVTKTDAVDVDYGAELLNECEGDNYLLY
jgi:hypothetical protein